MDNNPINTKNLHLATSTIIVVIVAIIYGWDPATLPSQFFDFNIESVDLKNIFRAMMGLYFAISIYWIIGMIKEKHWESATLFNVIFMGGLAFGRIISTLADGISEPFIKGLILELLLMTWGIINLKKYKK